MLHVGTADTMGMSQIINGRQGDNITWLGPVLKGLIPRFSTTVPLGSWSDESHKLNCANMTH